MAVERHLSVSLQLVSASSLCFLYFTTNASLHSHFSHSFLAQTTQNYTMPPIQIHSCLLFLVLALSPALLSHAKTAAPAVADAPSPVAEPLNFTHILEKGEQYKTFLRILKDTQVGAQVVNQLEDSIEGLTVMAPTDNAFNSLKPGTLNKLTNQQQSELVMYHILPKYYSFVTFQTTSNPVPTQATSEDGTCTVNITSGSNQVIY